MAEQRQVFKYRGLVQEELVFADLLRAVVIKKIDGVWNEHFKCKCVWFAIKPTERIIQKYNIPDSELTRGFIEREYPEHLIYSIYQDQHIARNTLVMCGLNGEKLGVVKIFQILLDELKKSRNENYILKKELLKKEEELEIQKTSPDVQLDKNVEVLRRLSPYITKEVTYEGKDNRDMRPPGL